MTKPDTLDLDALDASYTNTARISQKDVFALIEAARERDAARYAWCLLADYAEPHWRGAGLKEFGNWPLEVFAKWADDLDDRECEVEKLEAELATARAHLRQAVEALSELRNTFEDIFHEQRATKAIQELSNNGLDILDRLTAALGDQPPAPAAERARGVLEGLTELEGASREVQTIAVDADSSDSTYAQAYRDGLMRAKAIIDARIVELGKKAP